MKCSCGETLFYIHDIPCCDDCSENPAYIRNEDGGGFWKSVYDQKEIEEKDLRREGVEVDGECRLGYAYGAGCYLFICSKCRKKTHLPLQDSCY